MRNLLDLFDEVCNTMYELGIDPHEVIADNVEAQKAAAAIRVCGAYQPRYPLAARVSQLKALPDEKNPDASVVWVSLAYAPHDLSPYPPGEVFCETW
jgi:hypothetical protein